MKKTNLIAVLLIVVFVVLAVSSIWPDRKSPTCDELAHHIPVGYVLLDKGDFKMDTSHPPLSRYIVALPLKLFMNLNMPSEKSAWRAEDRSEFGKDFFYKYNSDPNRMIFFSRLAIVVVGVFCGIVLFVWTNMMFGSKVALFSLFLYSFSPNIIAHSRLATTDMVATLFILLAIFSFWLYLDRVSLGRLIFAGACLGLAQLSKYTSILLYPLFIVFAAFEFKNIISPERKGFIFKILTVFFISVIVLWAGYGFETKPILKGAMRVEEKLNIAHSLAQKVVPGWNKEMSDKMDDFLLNKPFPLGAHALGILGVVRHGYEGHGTFFLGRHSSFGSPLYFVVAFLVKTPIPTIIFFFIGLFVAVRRGIGQKERFLLLSILLFFITASMSKLQLGLRYILPVYPLCFIVAGKSLEVLDKKSFKVPIILLSLWYVGASLWIWPDYLSYFNEFIGGPKNGYKYLRDSNIDWGQDLPALAKYMKENNIQEVKLLYFGTADPASYGIKHKELAEDERNSPQQEVYAISVHKIEAAKWTKNHKPTARLGNSIYIYDFRVNSH